MKASSLTFSSSLPLQSRSYFAKDRPRFGQHTSLYTLGTARSAKPENAKQPPPPHTIPKRQLKQVIRGNKMRQRELAEASSPALCWLSLGVFVFVFL